MHTGSQQESHVRFAARERRIMRRTMVGVASVAAIAGSAVVLATATAEDPDTAAPAATVRAFLVDGVVDTDGFDACGYLTGRARAEVRRAAPAPDTSCETAMASARLRLGVEQVDDQALIKGLSYRVEQRGGRASVTVTADGAAHTFRLRSASPAELEEFHAPPTPWRIDSGVASLVPR